MKYSSAIFLALSALAQNPQSSVSKDFNQLSPDMNQNLADRTMINVDQSSEVRIAYAKKVVAMIASQYRTQPDQIQSQFQNLIDSQTDADMKSAFSDACNLWMKMNPTDTTAVPLTKEEMILKHKAVFQALIDGQVDPESKQAYQNQWTAWLKAANV
jgi:hypothetical protein